MNELGVGFTTDAFVPVVYAFMTPQEIRDVATWAEIERVYLAPTHDNELDMARQVIYAPSVNAMGITGYGVKIAQIEVGGRVATANPFLAGVIQDATFVCGGASGHSTAVAGMLRSTHSTVRGVSYGATLRAGGSCGGWSSELQNRSTAAADWGASALNLSWGSNIGLVPGSDDRFYDSLVMNRARTVVKSAGNQNGGCGAGDGNVTSPGLAYNVITVGNFNDFNTLSFFGDAIEGCSSFKDPTSSHGDREKPEVAAPGTNFVSTTTAWPWTGGVGSGTSYSAPMVTGTAALMMQRNSALSVWPESVKAIAFSARAACGYASNPRTRSRPDHRGPSNTRGRPVFHAAAPLDDADVEHLARTLQRRVVRYLRRTGHLPREHDREHDDSPAAEPDKPLFAELCAASVQGRASIQPESSSAVTRLGRRREPRSSLVRGTLCCDVEGFSLHAKVCVPEDQCERLEHLCRYVARAPIATERLSLAPDGRVVYRLRRHWRDGTSAISFDPLTFIERLAALVPRPRCHLLTYHGVLAPAAQWRDLIVPGPLERPTPASADAATDCAPARHSTQRRATWAELLKRVFDHTINYAPRRGCGRTNPDHTPVPSAVWAGDRLRRSPEQLG